MDRWLYASRSVRGRSDRMDRVLRAATAELLSGETDPPRAPDGSVLVTLPGRIAGVDVSKQVRIITGVAYRRLGSLRVPLKWNAEPLRKAFPSFEGYLEFDQCAGDYGQLTLVGRYRPPLGPMGAVADTFALGSVAQVTADVLLDRVCDGLSRHPDISTDGHAPPPVGPQLLVRDVMTPDPVTFDPDMDLPTAARLLLHFGISGAPVVTEDGELIGVLSESDLMEKEATPTSDHPLASSRRRREAVTAKQACTRPALTTHPAATLRDAARDMLDHRVSRLVVVDRSRVAGVVTRHDVLASLVRGDSEIAAHAVEVLSEMPEEPVDFEVEWGLIRLKGSVSSQEVEARLVERLRRIDGVTGVEFEQGWQVEGLAAPAVPRS